MLGLGRDAIRQQVRRAFLNIFIRNQDDHTKNIAFLMDSRGQWSLSPAFDIVYAYNPDGAWTSQHQMSLNGKTDGFGLDDLLTFGKFSDLKTAETKAIIADISAAIVRWGEFANIAGVSDAMASKARVAFRQVPLS